MTSWHLLCYFFPQKSIFFRAFDEPIFNNPFLTFLYFFKSIIIFKIIFTNAFMEIHITITKNRNSCSQKFHKKYFLKMFAKFTGKHLCLSLFLNEVGGIPEKWNPGPWDGTLGLDQHLWQPSITLIHSSSSPIFQKNSYT